MGFAATPDGMLYVFGGAGGCDDTRGVMSEGRKRGCGEEGRWEEKDSCDPVGRRWVRNKTEPPPSKCFRGFCLFCISISTGSFNDLYSFSPTSNTWAAHNASSAPSPRFAMGFAATPDGMLYVFGGSGTSGEK